MPERNFKGEFTQIANLAHELAIPSNPAKPDERTKVEKVAALLEAQADLMAALAEGLHTG